MLRKSQRQYDGSASGRAVYNYFRTYDPSTGRYLESDPIGLLRYSPDPLFSEYGASPTQKDLLRGLNHPYAYVDGNPLRYIDSLGLENFCTRVPDFYPEACRRHDECYSDPCKSKSECDSDFFWDAFGESGPSPNVLGPGIYYFGVTIFGGPYYRDAQNAARR